MFVRVCPYFPFSARVCLNQHCTCVVYLKVFEKLYAPLLNGILKPFKDDAQLHNNRTSLLDRVYRTVSSALDLLVDAVGLRAA